MEATGNYHASVAKLLHDAGLYVSVVNAKLVHDYGNNELRRVKTDRKDAVDVYKRQRRRRATRSSGTYLTDLRCGYSEASP